MNVVMCKLEPSFSRTDVEIDQELKPTMQKIHKLVNQRLEWRNVLQPVSKELLQGAIHQPTKAIFKALGGIAIGYVAYLFLKGIGAGIEVDVDSNFMDLFSSDRNTRLQYGLAETNGVQAGQFMVEAGLVGIVGYQLILSQSYNTVATKIIVDCYNPFIKKLLNSIKETRGQLEGASEEKKKQLDNQEKKLDRLYAYLWHDLKPYHPKPEEIEFLKENEEPLHSDENV